MFGYIHINRKELSEADQADYQAYYCGLCRALKSSCGTKGQMLLQYDMTFLVVLLTGLYELENRETVFTCALHPGKRRKAFLNSATEYAADMNLVLAYHNLLDDWKDDRSRTKKLLADRVQADYLRVAKRYPRQVEAVKTYLARLEELEKDEKANYDIAAGISGEILAEIFAWKEDEWKEELNCLGFYLGKFIYLMDAYEDMEKDRKNRNFNPLLKLEKEIRRESFEDFIYTYLMSQAAEGAKIFERLPILMHAEILRNILYSGIWSRYDIFRAKQKRKSKGKAG